MANDPTAWFNWDLPNINGDRNTWGGILRDRWSGLDDMLGGKVVPNSRWITFASSTDRGLVLSTEFEASNRAAIVFTDEADGVNPYAASQFEFRYRGDTVNEFTFQARDGLTIGQVHWRATGDLFRFENRVDVAADKDAAIYITPEDGPTDLAQVVFGPTKPTGPSVGALRRFALEYDAANGELRFQVYDNSGNFVTTALAIKSDGTLELGGGLTLTEELVFDSGAGIRNIGNGNLIWPGGDITATNLFVNSVGAIRQLERNTESVLNPWPY